MPAKCSFQLVLEQDPGEASGFTVLDAAGKRMNVYVQWGNQSVMGPYQGLADGSSEVVITDDRASTLILLKAGKEVRRVPIELRPGDVQVIHL